MLPTNNVLSLLWWGVYTIIGVWGHRTFPGMDFYAPGIILCLQKEGGTRTLWLAAVWILLIEGTGNIPFGYGLAEYSLLTGLFLAGQWLFESRSFLFMGLLGLALGVLHPFLIYGMASLANLTIPMKPVLIEGGIQGLTFPVIWLIIDYFYPTRLRQDVRSL